ncbi:hypothetical protein LCGC14_1888990 [marine sediment metagenome]|uniref:Uncharacterized protein n=1 Tax=marine sediment metagenome TaxID=412755 RepID=A0A0F9IY79_9ZZZZ
MNIDKIHKVESMFMYFHDVLVKVEKMHEQTIDQNRPDVAVYTKQAMEGINGIIDFVSKAHDDMLHAMGAIKVDVKDKNKPDLKLVVDNGPVVIGE